MDEIEEGLIKWVECVLSGIFDRDGGADKNIAQVGRIKGKCDAVCGTGVVKKLFVERSYFSFRNEIKTHFIAGYA